MNPTFEYEEKYWKNGMRFVAGADEVGRGAFAGPVVAAVVVFDPLNIRWPKGVIIRDSKNMSARQRLYANDWIKENTYWGIGEASVSHINRRGVGKSAQSAFRKAVREIHYHLPKRLDHLLVDAFFVPHVAGVRKKKQTAIIKGDNMSYSIAAASIIAKCHRDEIMKNLGKRDEYKIYKWLNNVGYGTEEHRNAINSFGITRHHRRAFIH
jgi:ribonuclease HII